MLLPSRRWLLGALLLAGIAPLGLLWPPAADLFVLLDAAWLIAWGVDAAAIPAPASLGVTREAPPAFSAGRSSVLRYHWHHDAARPLRLLVHETFPEPLGGVAPPPRSLTLAPAAETNETVEVTPARRGVGEGGRLAIRILGRAGLAWRQGRIDRPWTATVFPTLAAIPRRGIGAPPRRRDAGLRTARRLGEGRVFEALREWVPGDDSRAIDWKATARRHKLMARQYEDERRQYVLLVIDAGRLLTAEVEGVPRLESVVTAALRLAHAAVEHDDNVGLMVFARDVEAFIPPARGRRALRAVLRGLAAVEGRVVEPDYPAAFRYLAARNRRRALTVVFTDVIDRTASEALVSHAGALRPRHLPLAVTLRDPGLEAMATRRPANPREAFAKAAAEELLIAREEALGAMRARGVIVLDVPPSRAGDAVVEQYDQLKRRGVL